MKKIIYILLTFLLLWFFSVSNVNAIGLDNTWKLVDRSQWTDIKLLQWTSFKFSFYNKLYNYFRLTNDWAIAFWISPDNNTLSEWLYLADKNKWSLKVKAWGSVILTFTEDKTKITLPAWTNYININWQYKISDGIKLLNVRKWNIIALSDWAMLTTDSWLSWITYNDKTQLEYIKDNIDYTDVWTSKYVIISPWFIKLDLSDKDNLWHGIYEKNFYDPNWNLYATWFMWYWYVAWTTKEVQYWIVLYNSTYYNNIRLFYWNIDSTITTPVFAWISNWNASDKLNVAYSNSPLWSLSWKDDIVIDGSKIFQELRFPLWYEPNQLDLNNKFILDYQERDTTAPYPFLSKPQSKYAIKFKVKINTDKTVCQREWVTSQWWDTLRWWKKDSNRVDFDDIDTFCFSAETPWLVVLDNASYAKWWYKTWQSKCVVNHLSLMWFNSQSIWWNTKSANNCWLTYKIKESTKDLSLEKTSPYSIINNFFDDVDVRPIDTTITLNKNSIVFTNPKALIIDLDGWIKKAMNLVDPNFKPIELNMINDKVAYMIWYNWADSYLLYTNNRWDSWKILNKTINKSVNYFTIIDNVVLIFFNDWTYIRNIENWFGTWKEHKLDGYDIINDAAIINSRRLILVWNNWKIWKTFSAGDDFQLVNAKTSYWLETWEDLQSIDVYGSNDVWISSNRGNILYSPDAWDSFIKKTTWSSMEYTLNDFENGINVFENSLNKNTIWNNISYIDTGINKSLKFSNDYQYLNWCVNWNNYWQNQVTDTLNYTNLEPFTVDEYDKIWPKWDLYIKYFIDTKDQVKWLKTMTLEDDYWHNILIKVDDILKNQWIKQKIWWNKLKVSITDYTSPFYVIDAPDNTTSQIEHFQKISKYKLNDTLIPLVSGEKIGIASIKFAPSTNLSNIISVNNFNSTLTNTSTRTCKINNDLNLTNMTDWKFNLGSFIDTDWNLSWFLTLDIYVENKNNWGINSIALWNDNTKKIVWNDIKKFSSLGIDTINNWRNTFILPFNENNSANVTYTNKQNINWKNLTLFQLTSLNANDNTINRYAIDNIRYSSVANTNLKFITFFNKYEWLAFDNSNTYITNNNNTWWMNGSYSRWAWTNMQFKKIKKIKWREIYAIWNDSWGWYTYYSLDKWKNSKMYFSDSWIKMVTFDSVSSNDWLGISDNWTIYELKLKLD